MQQVAQRTHGGAHARRAVAALLMNRQELGGGGLEALLETGQQVHRPQHFGIAPRAVDNALALRRHPGASFRRGPAAHFAEKRQH